jgi:hypothetical protein
MSHTVDQIAHQTLPLFRPIVCGLSIQMLGPNMPLKPEDRFSPETYRNNLMTQICEALEELLPKDGTGYPPKTEHRLAAIYKELSEALGIPEGNTLIDDD